MILRHMGVEVPLKFLPHMPTGPYNRVAANRLAKSSLAGNPGFRSAKASLKPLIGM